ncbi:hypothetical protein Tco_1562739 [Tanacetum coccineum]
MKYMQQPMQNPEDISNPTTLMNMALVKTDRCKWESDCVQCSAEYRESGIANQNGNGNVVTTRAEAEEFDLMAAAVDCEEIEEVKVNCILMANLQQASTSGTHIDKAPVYDFDGLIEEQYTELLESTTDTHLVQQDDSNVILLDSSMNPSGGVVEQHHGTIEETYAFFESLYNNLAI